MRGREEKVAYVVSWRYRLGGSCYWGGSRLPLEPTGESRVPKLKNWFATRSKNSLRRRIHELESEAARMDAIVPVSEFEDGVLLGLEIVNMGVVLFLLLFLGVVAAVSPLMPFSIPWRLLLLAILGIFFRFLIVVAFRPVANWHLVRSPRRREMLKKNILQLTETLNKRDVS